MATPRPVLYHVIVMAFLAVGFCGVYELIWSWVSGAIKGIVAEKNAEEHSQ